MQKSSENAPGGEVVAETIYRAVTDGSWKMRYPINTKGMLLLRRFLPDSLFQAVIRMALMK